MQLVGEGEEEDDDNSPVFASITRSLRGVAAEEELDEDSSSLIEFDGEPADDEPVDAEFQAELEDLDGEVCLQLLPLFRVCGVRVFG